MPPSNEEALFALALAKPAAERTVWLDRECGGDKALRARLEALLAAHEQPETLLARQAEAARPTIKLELANASSEFPDHLPASTPRRNKSRAPGRLTDATVCLSSQFTNTAT